MVSTPPLLPVILHLGERFNTFYRGIVEFWLKAKEAGDMVMAAALKIAVYSVFGKLNSRFFWLFDPRTFFAKMLNGQLFILDLVK